MNQAIISGRLTRDPEVRYTQSGTAVCTFTLAVDRPWTHGKDQQSNQPTADFIPVVTWRKLAAVCGNNLVKGRRVGVHGRIQVRNYEAQDGSKRYVTEVVAEDLEFLDSRKDAGAAAPPAGGCGQTTGAVSGGKQDQTFGPNIPDEEIPF